MYEVIWLPSATISFIEEEDFILRKWNWVEVEKFNELVDDCIKTISKTPTVGIYRKYHKQYSFVISKQTTIFYKIKELEMRIELVLFWNNSQNPTQLNKLLK